MKKKKVNFMCTAFRDGFQSVYGARVFTKDFMPAVEAAREAGITHFEAGGGARFQSLYFYTNEDAFEMMDEFRKVAGPDADLQTLSRGVNVVGLDSQSRDIIKLHANMFKKHGISTIRNFDALNDVNNLIDSGMAIHDAGLRHEVTVTMMALPPNAKGAHNPEFYEKVLRDILDADIPFDSVCFKDASGTSTPHTVYETVKRARKLLGPDMNITFHSHETAGVSIQQYVSALEAGATQLDLSMSPVSGGTCQPDIITMWHALRGTDFDLGVDIKKIQKAESVFEDCMKDYFTPPEAKKVNPNIPFFPLPGGALTANTQMLRDNNLMDKFPLIVEAMGETVEKGGFGTSVTPVSQFYFQQAFNNVMFGPWKKIAEGYGKMVLGYFGKTPVEPDPEVVKIASKQLKLEPTTEKVVDINDRDPNKGRKVAIANLKKENLADPRENIFIAASCKEKGILYLTGKSKVNGVRKNGKAPAASQTAVSKTGEYTVKVNGKSYGVKLDGDNAIVNGTSYPLDVKAGISKTSSNATSTGKDENIKAPMPGLILRTEIKVGDKVEENQLLLVMEAMKMENEVFSTCSGTVKEIKVKNGDQLNAGDVLVVLSTEGPAVEETASTGEATPVKAPMPGLILRTEVKEGELVKENQLLLVMEAMKMENEIFAPCNGKVIKVCVSQGQQMNSGDELVILG